jgi:hypothetical protein
MKINKKHFTTKLIECITTKKEAKINVSPIKNILKVN